MSEALCRGTTEGANCAECPLATDGAPTKPVVSEYAEDPAWLIIGEGPGFNETRTGRPFVGASGSVVNQLLQKIGRPRDHLFVGNATLCMPPQGTPVEVREKAAECCKPRLQAELRQFPGKPILTLGAVAARAVIPKAVLDAIDPPDVPKTRKKTQKEKQKANRKVERKLKRSIEKLAEARFHKAEKAWRANLTREFRRRTRAKPDAHFWEMREQAQVRTALWKKALAEAPREHEQMLKELALKRASKPKKPPKKKPIKITDIVGTLFDVDVDGSGIRPVIPAIHPAALLRGGGATIGGSHTPDMAYVNLIYDAAKVDALAKGKNIRLTFNFAFEVVNAERADRLFIEALQEALEEGEVTTDLETYVEDPDRHHALMAYVAKIRVIGVATSKRSIAVAWDLLSPICLSYLQLALGRVKLITHHGLYDRTVLRAYGFIIPIVDIDEDAPEACDTLYAHHAAFPGNSHKLQTVAAQFYGVEPWKSDFRNQDETPERLATYCVKDTGATHALIPVLDLWVKRTRTEKVYARDRKMMDVASRMHLIGQPVSREVNSQLVSTFSKLARDARKKVESQANDKEMIDRIKHKLALLLTGKKRKKDEAELSPLREMMRLDGKKLDEYEVLYKIRKRDLDDEGWYWKINNSKHIAAFLQAIDAPLTQVTEQGQISTKREVLESLVDVPIVRDILEYRENEKMLDFTAPIFDRVDGNGDVSYGFADPWDRIHPIWSIHKISGRWAGTEPIGTSNPPREKTKRVPFGTTLPANSIITGFICECGAYEGDTKKHEGHVYKPKSIEYAYRPTTKRQIMVGRHGRVIIGFDYCLAKGTLIDTPNGNIAIEALKPGDLVYSFNHKTMRPDCSKVTNKVCTGRQKTMKVVLDNGEEVRCTYNHRWLTRRHGSGRTVFETEARDLKPGMRLLPLRRSYTGSGDGYETLYSYSAFEYVKTHVTVARAAFGERPDGHDVHHKNENSRDNRPSNLEYKPSHDHVSDHSERNAREQWKDPKTRKKMIDGISKAVEARGGHHGENNPNWGKHTGVDTKCPNCDAPTYLGGKHPKRFCSPKCYHEFRRKNPNPRGTVWGDLNHKVAKVIHDDLIVPTYDIEVERDHNFALSAGIFVHNCQVEARVIALISGDPFMCDVFDRNGDLHTECAIEVFNGFLEKTASERKMMRTVCKTLEYATWYGAADEKVWKGLLKEGYTLKLVDVVSSLNRLRKKMSGVIAWQRNTIHGASQPPYELREFVSGRRRVWPMGQVEASEALNSGPQFTASAIMNEGVDKMDVRIVDRGYQEAYMISQIHDAAYYEIWEDDVDAFSKDLTDCFESEHTNVVNGKTIRFPIEVGYGLSMADV